MNIRLTNGFTLMGDRFSIWLLKDRETINRAGKKVIIQDRVAGYCHTVSSLLEDFVNNTAKLSDATEVEQLLKDFAETETRLIDMITTLTEVKVKDKRVTKFQNPEKPTSDEVLDKPSKK